MISRTLLGLRLLRKFPISCIICRSLSKGSLKDSENDNGFVNFEEPLKRMWIGSDDGSYIDDKPILEMFDADENEKVFAWRAFCENAKLDAKRVLEVLQQDFPGFDARAALDEHGLRVSGILVREALLGILRSTDSCNKTRCARLGYKFFFWSSMRENYRHTPSSYHLMMKILAEFDEIKAMWRLADEMIEKEFPAAAWTFNILIYGCGEAGLVWKVVERFIKSKSFKYRPFKLSYNAIMHTLLTLNQYGLVEWVYEQMLVDGYVPDILTNNLLLCTNYRSGKLKEFDRLLKNMEKHGFSPDFQTYNIFLHVLGKGDKPHAGRKLLKDMKQVGLDPTVLHFTTLMDGLSRAGNLDACRYFFNKMVKHGCTPDVVCYTVMITGYVVAREIEKAKIMFDEMIMGGLLPNVFTYNSMIRGFISGLTMGG